VQPASRRWFSELTGECGCIMSSRQRFTLIILVLFLAGVLISFAALVKRGVEPSAPSQAIEMATQEKTGISLPAEITPPLATVVIPPAQPATETPLPAATVTPLPCPVAVSGGLVTEMRSIVDAMPGAGSNDFILPSNEQIAAWEVIVRAAALGDAPTACAIIQAYGFPYQVVQFTDTPFEDQEYILLREVEPVNAGWGTYVFHADAKTSPIVIEVPHPAVDWNTEIEGVEMHAPYWWPGRTAVPVMVFLPVPERPLPVGRWNPTAFQTLRTMSKICSRLLIVYW
jgi:hypothetical protein